MYDVAIIGAGVTGCSIARELSRYNLKTILIEKDNDVANGTTKANSAIIHAGYDPVPGTLKAKLNVAGNAMFDKITEELDVPFKRVGTLVVAFCEEEMEEVRRLYEQGVDYNVPDIQVLDKEALLEMEPNLSDEVVGALYAPSGGIIGPWELAIALAENAVDNVVELKLNAEVKDIKKLDEGYEIVTASGNVKTKYVINAAGLYSDKIHNMVSTPTFEIIPTRGEYHLFDKSEGDKVSRVIFQAPSKISKGVVVLPTIHGNLLVGPNAEAIEDRQGIETTREALDFVAKQGSKSVKELNFGNVITSFAGLRSKTPENDFIIEESADAKNFINVAAIDSPGLSAAPAIAEYTVEILKELMGELEENKDFNPIRRPHINFIELSDEEKAELIKKDPRYGRVICRCESITEGEIVDIIHRSVGATTVDGIKRRARAGMGRCQGGFCAPRVMEIIARELNKDITEVVKDRNGSYILTGPTKEN